MAAIQPFHAMDLLARARALEAQGRTVVHMEIGEPDFPTPVPVVEAGRAALAAGRTHYTPATGLPALREQIAAFYQSEYGVTVAPEQVVVTPGASGALLLLMGVLIDRDESVLLTDPGYPCNRHFVRLLEGQACALPVTGSTGYQLTAAQVSESWQDNTRAVMLASPANPTGIRIGADEIAAIAGIARKRGGYVIVDEIYQQLVYGCHPETALTVADDLFIVNSFSKYFGMTGWRLGWLVAPEVFVRDIDKLAQNIFLAASTPAQYAALAAFTAETREILEGRREIFRQRRDFLLPALRALGFSIPLQPEGAFYLYADCSRFTDDSYHFASELLESAGVAITPGIDFGKYRAGTHVRFAYTTSLEQLETGVERLAGYL